MRRPWVAALAAWFLIIGFLLSVAVPSAAWADDAPPGRVLATAIHPLDRGDATVVEDRIVLAEIFTATWCPPCAPAERALERIIDEYSPGLNTYRQPNATADAAVAFALLSYHPFPDVGGEDPFGTPAGHARLAAKHNVFWFPSFFADGVYEDQPASRQISVDAGMEGVFYASYRGLIDVARGDPPVFRIQVESARLTEDADAWDVTVTLTPFANVARPLYVQAAVWEDPVRFAGSNGIDEHRMVVRSLVPRATIEEPLASGAEWTHTWRIDAPAQAREDRLGVTLFVETAWHKEEPRPIGVLLFLAGFVVASVAVVAAIDVRSGQRARSRRGRDA